MRTVLRSLVTTVALAAFAVPSLASAAGTATVPTRHLTAEGGTVKWPVAVHNAKTCSWSSSPSVAGFTTTVKCKSGRVERSFRFGANPLTKAKDYTLSLTVRGKATTVDHLKVVEAGRTTPTTTTVPPTTTTTSSTTSTTTTTVTTTPPPPASPGLTSPNWSGYVLTGASGGYQAISAKWTVPAVVCSSLQNSETSDWVGVNGWLGADWGGLFQDGTTSYCFNGQQGDYAWWTDALASYSAPTLFVVAPGDVIDAEVYQASSGYWAYNIADLTSGRSSSSAESFSGPGTSAEWIAEDTGDPNTGLPYPLADFGSVTFTDLGLTVPSGSWTVPPDSDAIEMVAPDRSVEALPSQIQGSGASAAFTVTYETPGEMSSTAGTAAVKHPRSTFAALVPPIVLQPQARRLGDRSIPGPESGAGSHQARGEGTGTSAQYTPCCVSK
ncbi:MAG: G1 family glutamic endopeptidase [Acidimicrobiales bacterium]